MRTLKRNKVPVWYYLFYGKTEEYDSQTGIYTGEWEKEYLPPQKIMANVAPATGNANVEPFGIATDYSHIMVVENDNDIHEDTIVFIGDDPTYATEGFYRVVRIAKSLNHTRIALRELELEEVPFTPPTPGTEGDDDESSD